MKKMFSYDKYPAGRRKMVQEVEIKCVNCATVQLNYKKEGSGAIDRIFFDSMINNPWLKNNKQLICPECEKVLGVRFMFGKEKKMAFKLYPGSVFYKTIPLVKRVSAR